MDPNKNSYVMYLEWKDAWYGQNRNIWNASRKWHRAHRYIYIYIKCEMVMYMILWSCRW
jgi:hypothetical protein